MEKAPGDDGARLGNRDQRVLLTSGGLLKIDGRIAPDILPPAFFPVGLNLCGRTCVVIGAADDREATEKSTALSTAGADVVRIHDFASIRDEDVRDAFFVILTLQNETIAAELRRLADRYKFLFCAIDQPKYGFVAMTAGVVSGRARITISTGGAAPRVARKLREALQASLDDTFARFLECFAVSRRRIRAQEETSAARRTRMTEATDGFDVEIRLTYPRWFRDELRRLGPTVIDEP